MLVKKVCKVMNLFVDLVISLIVGAISTGVSFSILVIMLTVYFKTGYLNHNDKDSFEKDNALQLYFSDVFD